jgi:hypothetical protein
MRMHPASNGTSFLALPRDVLWWAFTFAPCAVWWQLNRMFYERFAHRWVRMRPSHARFLKRLKGRVEKLDLVAVDNENIDALQCLGSGACPGLWNIRIELRNAPHPPHAAVLNTILRGSDHALTHFALEINFPASGAFTYNAADNGIGLLLHFLASLS